MSLSEEALNQQERRAVLVVEDEPRICELLTDILQMHGHETECVQSDEEALDALRRGPPFACMIVDVNLGAGTKGYDVARFARTIQPSLPVIYVSGQTSEASFAANGVTGSLFIPKPFTADELIEQVHKLVGDNDD